MLITKPSLPFNCSVVERHPEAEVYPHLPRGGGGQQPAHAQRRDLRHGERQGDLRQAHGRQRGCTYRTRALLCCNKTCFVRVFVMEIGTLYWNVFLPVCTKVGDEIVNMEKETSLSV